MRSATHVAAAACSALVLFEPMVSRFGWMNASIGVWALMVGSKAPDWLELRRWWGGKRFSVIPHRTLTHTWWVWVAAMILAPWWLGLSSWVALAWQIFCLSCLLHVAMDAMTPMGVPLLNPFGAKTSLGVPILRTDLGFIAAWGALSWGLWRLGLGGSFLEAMRGFLL